MVNIMLIIALAAALMTIILTLIGTVSQIVSPPENENEFLFETGMKEVKHGIDKLKEIAKEAYNYLTGSKNSESPSLIKDLTTGWEELNKGLVAIGEKIEEFMESSISNTKEFFKNLMTGLTKCLTAAGTFLETNFDRACNEIHKRFCNQEPANPGIPSRNISG